jgi:hypothetical protein
MVLLDGVGRAEVLHSALDTAIAVVHLVERERATARKPSVDD